MIFVIDRQKIRPEVGSAFTYSDIIKEIYEFGSAFTYSEIIKEIYEVGSAFTYSEMIKEIERAVKKN